MSVAGEGLIWPILICLGVFIFSDRIHSGLPWHLALLWGILPVAAPFLFMGSIYGADLLCYKLAARRALRQQIYSLRAFTVLEKEIWMTWLPGVRQIFQGRKTGEVFLREPMFGDFCWRDELHPDEWAELEKILDEECRRENQRRARVAVVDRSEVSIEELKRLNYVEMKPKEFKISVEKWCVFLCIRHKLRKSKYQNGKR